MQGGAAKNSKWSMVKHKSLKLTFRHFTGFVYGQPAKVCYVLLPALSPPPSQCWNLRKLCLDVPQDAGSEKLFS